MTVRSPAARRLRCALLSRDEGDDDIGRMAVECLPADGRKWSS